MKTLRIALFLTVGLLLLQPNLQAQRDTAVKTSQRERLSHTPEGWSEYKQMLSTYRKSNTLKAKQPQLLKKFNQAINEIDARYHGVPQKRSRSVGSSHSRKGAGDYRLIQAPDCPALTVREEL